MANGQQGGFFSDLFNDKQKLGKLSNFLLKFGQGVTQANQAGLSPFASVAFGFGQGGGGISEFEEAERERELANLRKQAIESKLEETERKREAILGLQRFTTPTPRVGARSGLEQALDADPTREEATQALAPFLAGPASSRAARIAQGFPAAGKTPEQIETEAAARARGRAVGTPRETPEQIEAEAFAKTRGKLRARRQNINQILGMPEGTTPAAPVFSGDTAGQRTGTGDTARLAGLLTNARRLRAAGETTLANSYLSEARFLADNSPELQKQKNLNKPVSRELAAELGVPVGTTLGEVRESTLPTPEEQAETQSRASARGRSSVEAEQELGFVQQGRSIVGDLLQSIEADPGIVGVRGSLRSTGKAAKETLGDLGLRPLFEQARDIAFSGSDIPLDEAKGFFDNPKLSTLKLLENSLGLILARIRNPDGRVPVDIIQRSIQDVKLSGLTGTRQVVDRLTFLDNLLSTRQGILERMSGREQPQGTPRFRLNPETGDLEQVN